jgi:hypothetical protein
MDALKASATSRHAEQPTPFNASMALFPLAPTGGALFAAQVTRKQIFFILM